jgi:non-ribosomal peptide synthetase component F
MGASRRGNDKEAGGTFQAFFVHHDMGFFRSRAKTSIPGIKTKLLMMEDGWEMLQPAAMFDLQLLVQEDRGSVSLRIEYNADVLEHETVARMGDHYLTLLTHATTEDKVDSNVWRVELLSDKERHKLLVEWNNTFQALPSAGKCMHQLISDQATRTPNNIALVYPEEGGGRLGVAEQSPEPQPRLTYRQSSGKMTYAELEQISNFLAQHLMSLGVGPDDLVGLSVEQSSWVMVVGMIAIWKAGGAYVALNPRLPPDRLKYMIEKTNSRVVLTLSHLVPSVSAATASIPKVRVVDVDGQWKRIQAGHRPVRPKTTVAEHNLAYVLFTSGSTGLPKGVMIEHKALVNRLVTYANDHLTQADRVAQVSAYSFDASLPELFSTLSAGASLYLLPVGVLTGPELALFWHNNNITNGGILTPSRMATLKNERYPNVNRVVAIGEQLTTNIVKMMAIDGRRIYNTYLIIIIIIIYLINTLCIFLLHHSDMDPQKLQSQVLRLNVSHMIQW